MSIELGRARTVAAIAAAAASVALFSAPARAQPPPGAGVIDLGDQTLTANKADSEWTLTNKQTGAVTNIQGDDAFGDDCKAYAKGPEPEPAGLVWSAFQAVYGKPTTQDWIDLLNQAQKGCNIVTSPAPGVSQETLQQQQQDELRKWQQDLTQREQDLRQREERLRLDQQGLAQAVEQEARREEQERRREQSGEHRGPSFVIPLPGFGRGFGGGRSQGQGGRNQGQGGQGQSQGQGQRQGQGQNCHTNPVTGQYHCE